MMLGKMSSENDLRVATGVWRAWGWWTSDLWRFSLSLSFSLSAHSGFQITRRRSLRDADSSRAGSHCVCCGTRVAGSDAERLPSIFVESIRFPLILLCPSVYWTFLAVHPQLFPIRIAHTLSPLHAAIPSRAACAPKHHAARLSSPCEFSFFFSSFYTLFFSFTYWREALHANSFFPLVPPSFFSSCPCLH